MEAPYFADAQGLVIGWLRTQLSDVRPGVIVGNRVPTTRSGNSGELVVVRGAGGVAERPILDKPRLDFMCWAATDADAMALALEVRRLVVYELAGNVLSGHTFYRTSEFSGPDYYADPAGSNVPIVMFTEECPVRVRSFVGS